MPGGTGKARAGALLPFKLRKRPQKATGPGIVRTLTGRDLQPRKPLRSGGLRKRPRVPVFWRPLAFPLAGSSPVPEGRLNDWLLVLTAKKIPYQYSRSGNYPHLYVPPMQEQAALHEIRAFEAERPIPVFIPPARDNISGVLIFLLFLLLWHALRWNWFGLAAPSPPFPETAGAWSAAFGLDMYRFRTLHEFWRAVTALTMHADDAHLFSNLGFGLLFLVPLCRRAGLGLGLALTVLAGICGNACNSLLKDAHIISIGFSTALFGAIGALCALTGADIYRHLQRFAHMHTKAENRLLAFAGRLFAPLAAGLALLGILGGGGEARTDYSAHICGFCCGVILTCAALPLEKRLFALPKSSQERMQAVLLALSAGLFVLAWGYALVFR